MGKIGDTGLIGFPDAVCGMGCVGHGFSPSSAVSVGTGISLISCTGSPVSAIQDVEIAVFACFRDRPDASSPHLHVEEDRWTARVVVPHVVMRLLSTSGASRAELERDDRVGEEVHACTLPAVAERIPDRDVEQAQLGIDRRRLPDSAAVSFTADPCGTGDLPALIFSSCGTVLKCQRTFPISHRRQTCVRRECGSRFACRCRARRYGPAGRS